MNSDEKKVEIFKRQRARLFGIAYRMLGTHAESEDILQEAYIKWHQTKAEEIETPEEELELASNLSMAFMFLLERLSPVERAAFLLHDIFDCAYSDVARIVGKTETASRQLIHRARERVRTDKQRFEADEKMRENLIKKFATASKTGDEKMLFELFSDEILSVSDGGGKVTAARKIIRDKAKLTHALGMFGKKYGESFNNFLYRINGELGVLTFIEGKIYSATTFDIEEGKISAVYRVMNPDKLKVFEDLNLQNLAVNKEPLS